MDLYEVLYIKNSYKDKPFFAHRQYIDNLEVMWASAAFQNLPNHLSDRGKLYWEGDVVRQW